jgi:hypothetical protein
MGKRRSLSQKVTARKKVNVALLEREHGGLVTTAYKLMDEIISQHHSQLWEAEAKIAIAWRFGWKANADGRITLGQCKKGSDLDRAMHGFDFVILLNHEVWNMAGFSEAQMRALIDHELCHAAISKDSNGELKKDEKGRTVFRIRKHDLEEFKDVVARHGLWKDDVREFVEAANKKTLPLFDGEHEGNGAAKNGATPVNRIKRTKSAAK